METLPSYAKISEYQLRIASPESAPRNVMNLKVQAPTPAVEMWVAQIAFASMTVENLRQFLGWLAALDGRLTAFGVPVVAGVLTALASHTATLAADVAPGDSVISLNLTPGSGTLLAGTMLTLGASGVDAYQVVEVLADVAASGSPADVEISPRARWAFTSGATVVVGATTLRVRLASDDTAGSHSFNPATGEITLDLVEGVYA